MHAYLVLLPQGWMLVDGGAGTDEAWDVLRRAVAARAGGWDAVRLHVVTHMHLDHAGLSARVRAASGAPVAMGALDAERMRHAAAHPEEEAAYRASLLRAAGAPGVLVAAVEAQRTAAAALTPPVSVDRPLRGESGPLAGAPGWRWIWTPGHTAGHVSLHREADGTVIAGDAVLASVTPTLGVNRQRADPVGDYLEALDRLAALRPARFLGGHGTRCGPERLAELRAAALAEEAAVAACVGSTPAAAWQVTVTRYAERDLPVPAQMLALRETRAHLDRLAAAGRLHRSSRDGIDWFAREP